jgi:hypothetical protein
MEQDLATREELITVIDFLLEEIQKLDAHKQWLCPTPDYSIIALAEHLVAAEDAHEAAVKPPVAPKAEV